MAKRSLPPTQGLRLVAPDLGALDLAPATAPRDRGYDAERIGYGGDIARPRERRAMVCSSLHLGPGRPTMISAKGGTGKSILVRSLLLAVSAGLSHAWGSQAIHRHGEALELSWECPEDEIDDCYQRLALGLGIEIPASLGRLSFPSLDLTDSEVGRWLEGLARDRVLIAIDSLSAATSPSGLDPNDARNRVYLDLLAGISARTDCTFVVIAHEGWNAGRSRGSSALVDACQCCFSLAADDDLKTLTQTKTNVGRAVAPIHVRVRDVSGPQSPHDWLHDRSPGLVVESVSPAEAIDQAARNAQPKAKPAALAEVLDVLREHQPEALSDSKIRSAIAIRRGAKPGSKARPDEVRAALQTLIQAGEVSCCEVRPKNGKPFPAYRLGQDGSPGVARYIDTTGSDPNDV